MNRLSISFAILALAACGSSQDATTTPVAQATPETAAQESPPIDEASEPTTKEGWTLRDLGGNEVSLASYQGKTLVLEWFNPACPFVVQAHSEGALKGMAERVTASGEVAWLAINSTAQGDSSTVANNQQAASSWNIENPILMDTEGKVGRLYGAKSTPHMFILDGTGQVVYQGALDNAPRGEGEGEYVNYVEAALSDLAAGNPVATAETKSYGCSVKY